MKVITINTLYHARVLDRDLHPLSKHIQAVDGLDRKLREGAAGVVDEIWKSRGTKHHYFSFASKFCSWHNQEAYAIYDRNVWQALVAYRAKGDGFAFKTSECDDYIGFIEVVRRFRKFYGLDSHSLKSIDKFLWQVGGRLIAEREKASPQTTLAV